MIEKEQLEKIVRMVHATSDDYTRLNCQKIHFQKGHCFATDGHVMAWADLGTDILDGKCLDREHVKFLKRKRFADVEGAALKIENEVAVPLEVSEVRWFEQLKPKKAYPRAEKDELSGNYLGVNPELLFRCWKAGGEGKFPKIEIRIRGSIDPVHVLQEKKFIGVVMPMRLL